MEANQIIEAVKNLNLTFDGKLNSETLLEMVKVIAPYYAWYLVRGFALSLLGIILGTVCVYWITKAIISFGSKEC